MPTQQNSIFRRVPDYRNLHLYQKSDVLVVLTDRFCKRFLPPYGDRTVDQMTQAARSGKQNIVEGSEAAMTSSETEVKLVNVGRASLQELREDYEDYLKKHSLPLWDKKHPRFEKMLAFCREHNTIDDYCHLAETLSAEEFCNMAITLCHITDKMADSYLHHLESRFVTEGGVKERMHAARTSYRQQQDSRMQALEEENRLLKAEIVALRKKLADNKP
ncbi:MAG: four helix bundle suffix domain-containing protein [Bacteroidales bacterium]|nr:four helix bundle suffix domain-containing protein [Bacteroidales bacterium]